MSGWNLVDPNTNKSLPSNGVAGSGIGGAMMIAPSPGSQDAVGKMRVSTPRSLIDTDFEYGQQPTKWESIGLVNNRQSTYYIPQAARVVTAVTGDGTTRTVVVSMASTTGFLVGTPIFVQNSADNNANGWYMVTAVSAGVSVTYVASGIVANGNQYSTERTYVYLGYFYSNAGISLATSAFTTAGGVTVTCTTSGPHGLGAGSLIYVIGTTGGGATTPQNGAWVVTTTPTNNTFTFDAAAAVVNSVVNSAGTATLYARTAGGVESRPFDGGVAFTAGNNQPNAQQIRQTRRYFRYQSGKSIQFSTGTSLKPTLFLSNITASGATVTVTTLYPHNMSTGSTLTVTGCTQTAYNGTYAVASTPTATTLTYTADATPSASPATGFPIRVSPASWYGSSSRVGFFDQQNGLFFEHDGQTTYVVWRNSVQQVQGTISVTNGSSLVTGVGTLFATGGALSPGDFVVIRGQSYRITNILTDTTMHVSPEYRGATSTSSTMSKTTDNRVPQSQWADKLDGTGPSGYTLDLTRMQMFYIEYSWYGAGFARFGMRTTNGAIAYVYQFTNNNVQYEAYMRSGNMAAHYESNGIGAITKTTATLANTATTGDVITVASTAGFAPSGTVKVSNAAVAGTVEYISYSAKTATTLTIAARTQSGGNGTAQTFTYSASAPVAVEYSSPDTLASLSHWGSSVIMDGGFDDDKSLIFNYGMTTVVTTTATTAVVLAAIRIAPSVDNNTTGLFGAKATINRMQLALDSLGVYTTGTGYLINLVLNGVPGASVFSGAESTFRSPVQQAGGITSSLAQIALNTNLATTMVGGESVFAGYTNPTGVTTFDLSGVRDLGNSILGGGTTNTVPNTTVTGQAGFYPDGPDILYVVAVPLTSTSSTILARLGWKEAQA
tara:strand:- start:1360 stop:4035 length:2676 start_codon:yes stop_codon:yes gene_type:complete